MAVFFCLLIFSVIPLFLFYMNSDFWVISTTFLQVTFGLPLNLASEMICIVHSVIVRLYIHFVSAVLQTYIRFV